MWLEVKMKKSSPILVGFLYRNPSEPANWVDKSVCMMDSLWLESKEIILMGNFNIDLFKANKSWTETFFLFNLSQIIDSPTHITPSYRILIDHIYSSTPLHIQEVCVLVLGVSDHYPICCTWSKKGLKIPKLGLTPEIRDAMHHRDYLLCLNHFNEYKRNRNKVTYMIRDSKKKLFEKILTAKILNAHGKQLTSKLTKTHMPVLSLVRIFPPMN